MVSIASIIGTFPPASLASADLCRFLTRLLNRRGEDELASMRSFALSQPIPGYPANLGPMLVEIIETITRDGLDPASLDPERVEELLGKRAFQLRLDERVPLTRTPLRPGVPVSSEIRDMLGPQLQVVHGVGDRLVLVSPVEVVALEGLGWACARQAAVARVMQGPEAEILRLSWAGIEECFGWGSSRLELWTARYVKVATRTNLPASDVAAVLADMPQEERLALWRVLVEHNRDLELSDAYRPGSKGLKERLSGAGIKLEDGVLLVLLPLARRAYQACSLDSSVAEGVCPVTDADLQSYLGRVDVSAATRERLETFASEKIEVLLRELAAAETHRLDVAIDEDLRRDLRGLRDTLLSRRYRRDVSVLWGMDPLVYTNALAQTGSDRKSIERDLKALVEEARQVAGTTGTGLLGRPIEAAGIHQHSLALESAVQSVELQTEDGPIEMTAENPFVPDEEEEEMKLAPPSLPLMENPFQQPEMKDLPPLPKPPKRNRPKTETKIELPPMPEIPPQKDVAKKRRKSPTEEFESMPLPERPAPKEPLAKRRKSLTEEFESMPLPAIPPQRALAPKRRKSPTEEFESMPLPEIPAKRPPPVVESDQLPEEVDFETLPPPRPNVTKSQPQLVTPFQAVEFYRNAFRELQVMERDLLQGGPWQEASERLAQLAVETAEIVASLGPSARSGDQDFNLALKKVQVVESYLKRVLPLLNDENQGDNDKEPSGFGRLFRKRKP